MSCNSDIYEIKQGFADELIATITDDGGSPVDLTIYDLVTFVMINTADGTTTVNSPATFVDKPTGKVKYTFTVGQTATIGNYKYYFKLSIGGVPKKSAPKGYNYIAII